MGRALKTMCPELGVDPPSWGVAGATLAVAALFQPARRTSKRWLISASTGANTMPPRPSKRSAPDYASRSTSTHSRPSCRPSSTRQWRQPARPYDSGRRQRRQRTVEGEQASACLAAG